MKGIKMELSKQDIIDIADKVAIAACHEEIPLGGFGYKLCRAYCHADSGNRAKILKGFSDDFVAWYLQWQNEIETRYN